MGLKKGFAFGKSFLSHKGLQFRSGGPCPNCIDAEHSKRSDGLNRLLNSVGGRIYSSGTSNPRQELP